MRCCAGVQDPRARNRLQARGMVAAHALRQLRAHAGARRERRGRVVRTARGRRPHAAVRGRLAVHQSRARQRRQCAPVRQHRERARGDATAWCCSTTCARACRPVTIRRVSTAIRACTRPCSSCSGCGWSGCWVRRGCARPPSCAHDPSEAELVRRAGGLIARTVAPHHTALRAVRSFLRRRGARRAPRGRCERRARRPVAMARASRRHPAAGARPAESLVRGCARGSASCRWCRCRTFSITWNDD